MPQRIQVLLIDDDPGQCETLADILEDEECVVTLCTDSCRAEATARSRRFELVLLDLKMVGMSGLELLRRLRPLGHSCIIVLTAVVDPVAKRAALAEGADAVMDKPVDIPLLLEIAREVQFTGNCQASAALVPVP